MERIMSNAITIKAFFDNNTFTVTYVVYDNESKQSAVIDSVLDYDVPSGRSSTQSADQVIEYVKEMGLTNRWILESHAHADHLSAAPYLKKSIGGAIAIGSQITQVQLSFKDIFNMEPEFLADGSQFDRLLDEGDTLQLGNSAFSVMHTPGHTPACLSYHIDDAIFVGDTLFMPDFGSARTDFPGGDAATLFHSIKRILSLPDSTRVFTGHDYKAEGRDVFAWESSVAEQNEKNIHVNNKVTEEQFVEYRTTRDATLSLPKLILPAVQVNIRAGNMPPAESNGTTYLKLPINLL
jgi:glyoxylase-like metal-dependent hydrolase (beta-lactamase superfamily II)